MALNIDETYISLEGAREYADTMGLTLLEDDAQLEVLLKRAAILLDRQFGQRYLSVPLDAQQYLFWPRRDVNGGLVPAALGQAQVELAALMVANDGVMPSPAPLVKRQTTKVGGLEETIEFAGDNGYGQNPFAGIEQMLAPFFTQVTETGVVVNRRPVTMTRGA